MSALTSVTRLLGSLLLISQTWAGPADIPIGASINGYQPTVSTAPSCCTYDRDQNFTCACAPAEMAQWLGFAPQGPEPVMRVIGDRFAWSVSEGDQGGPGAQFRVACTVSLSPFGVMHARVVTWAPEPSVLLNELQPPLPRAQELTCAVRRENGKTQEASAWSEPIRFMVRP